MSRRVALLVDGDNVSAKHSSRILSQAAQLGRVDVARVYGAANCNSDWLGMPGFRFMHAGAGKNAADLLLSIDAMELALADGAECFVIATSDGDFTHLALRLREKGLHVLGIGETKTPDGFRLACSDFLQLNTPRQPILITDNPNPCDKLDRQIREMISRHSTNGRGMRIADLAPKMHATHRIKISTFPERTWRGYLSARKTLYQIDPKGPEAMVRFLPDGFAEG